MVDRQATARFKELNRLIKARTAQIVKDFDQNRSLEEFLQMFYDDSELVSWHKERTKLYEVLGGNDSQE